MFPLGQEPMGYGGQNQWPSSMGVAMLRNTLPGADDLLKGSVGSNAGMVAAYQPPGKFIFRPRTGRINWRLLHSLDLDRVIREGDIDVIQAHMDNITYSRFGREDLEITGDDNIIKVVQLSQLCMEFLNSMCASSQHLIQGLSERVRVQAAQLKAADTTWRRSSRRRAGRRSPSHDGAAGGTGRGQSVGVAARKCPHCPKRFQTEQYLLEHILRRHTMEPAGPMSNPSQVVHQPTPIEPSPAQGTTEISQALKNATSELQQQLQQVQQNFNDELQKMHRHVEKAVVDLKNVAPPVPPPQTSPYPQSIQPSVDTDKMEKRLEDRISGLLKASEQMLLARVEDVASIAAKSAASSAGIQQAPSGSDHAEMLRQVQQMKEDMQRQLAETVAANAEQVSKAVAAAAIVTQKPPAVAFQGPATSVAPAPKAPEATSVPPAAKAPEASVAPKLPATSAPPKPPDASPPATPKAPGAPQSSASPPDASVFKQEAAPTAAASPKAPAAPQSSVSPPAPSVPKQEARPSQPPQPPGPSKESQSPPKAGQPPPTAASVEPSMPAEKAPAPSPQETTEKHIKRSGALDDEATPQAPDTAAEAEAPGDNATAKVPTETPQATIEQPQAAPKSRGGWFPSFRSRSTSADKAKTEKEKQLPKEKKDTLLTRRAFANGLAGFLSRCRTDLGTPGAASSMAPPPMQPGSGSVLFESEAASQAPQEPSSSSMAPPSKADPAQALPAAGGQSSSSTSSPPKAPTFQTMPPAAPVGAATSAPPLPPPAAPPTGPMGSATPSAPSAPSAPLAPSASSVPKGPSAPSGGSSAPPVGPASPPGPAGPSGSSSPPPPPPIVSQPASSSSAAPPAKSPSPPGPPPSSDKAPSAPKAPSMMAKAAGEAFMEAGRGFSAPKAPFPTAAGDASRNRSMSGDSLDIEEIPSVSMEAPAGRLFGETSSSDGTTKAAPKGGPPSKSPAASPPPPAPPKAPASASPAPGRGGGDGVFCSSISDASSEVPGEGGAVLVGGPQRAPPKAPSPQLNLSDAVTPVTGIAGAFNSSVDGASFDEVRPIGDLSMQSMASMDSDRPPPKSMGWANPATSPVPKSVGPTGSPPTMLQGAPPAGGDDTPMNGSTIKPFSPMSTSSVDSFKMGGDRDSSPPVLQRPKSSMPIIEDLLEESM